MCLDGVVVGQHHRQDCLQKQFAAFPDTILAMMLPNNHTVQAHVLMMSKLSDWAHIAICLLGIGIRDLWPEFGLTGTFDEKLAKAGGSKVYDVMGREKRRFSAGKAAPF